MASKAQSGDSSAADHIDHFLEEMRYHGRSDRTRAAYDRVLSEFERYCREERGTTVAAAGRADCMAWVHGLRDQHRPSTIASYASYLHRFYDYMTRVGALDDNPMAIVTEEMDEAIDTDPARRDLSVPEMREFVASIDHPLDRVLIVTLLKTGIRVGELANLDRRDLHLAGVEDAIEGSHRARLDGRPDSLFVSSEAIRGAEINGEERVASNKRQRDTVIPVDSELRQCLVHWLAMRPDARSPADPLFPSTREWGRRVTTGMVRDIVTEHARDAGWYADGGDPTDNVTPHYFRHFFTTHLRDRTGDRGIVKYLRGDVAGDIIDTYTHNWGNRVREVYERNIYSVL